MSLTALPVSQSDLTTLQQGVQFFTNPAQAASQATAINAAGSNSKCVHVCGIVDQCQRFVLAGGNGGWRYCRGRDSRDKRPHLSLDAIPSKSGQLRGSVGTKSNGVCRPGGRLGVGRHLAVPDHLGRS